MQSAFVPDATLHALVCGTCGAPLKAQKQRPLSDHKGAKLPNASTLQPHGRDDKAAKVKKPKPVKTGKPGKSGKSGDWSTLAHELAAAKLMKKRKKKKKSSWKMVFDVIEDIFD
ncbi:MAG: hypothetical protein EpisKO_24550 [Epibacterium sp.]